MVAFDFICGDMLYISKEKDNLSEKNMLTKTVVYVSIFNVDSQDSRLVKPVIPTEDGAHICDNYVFNI